MLDVFKTRSIVVMTCIFKSMYFLIINGCCYIKQHQLSFLVHVKIRNKSIYQFIDLSICGLTCVYPPVGFEVGALGVNFFAAFIVAHVDPSPLEV